jgi:hypothetical protein
MRILSMEAIVIDLRSRTPVNRTFGTIDPRRAAQQEDLAPIMQEDCEVARRSRVFKLLVYSILGFATGTLVIVGFTCIITLRAFSQRGVASSVSRVPKDWNDDKHKSFTAAFDLTAG